MGLQSLLISLIVLGTGAGLGRVCSGLWRPGPSLRSERMIIDTAFGLGLLSLVILALGIGQMLSPAGAIIFMVPAVIALLGLRSVVPDLIAIVRRVFSCPRSAVSIVTFVMLAALALSALIPALAPPSMSDWDSLAYHLSVPKLYLQHGGIYYIDVMSHSNFPLLLEMLYIPGLALGSPAGAKMMHYWMGVLLIGAVVVVVRRHFDAKAAPLAAIAVASMPMVLWEATTAYVDLATALYTVLGVHLVLSYLDSSDRKFLVGTGIAAGFAASTKMTGSALIPVLAGWVLVDRLISEKREFAWKPALLAAAIGVVVCAPWYLRSFIYTGNPVYPFFYSIFGGANWTPELAAHYSEQQALFGVGRDLASFVFLPYDLTFNSHAFYDTAGLFIGPIVLVSLPVLVVSHFATRKLRGIGAFIALQWVIWFMLTQQSRYLLPTLALLAVLVSVLVYRESRLRFARAALWGAFILTAVFGLWTMYPAFVEAAPVVAGAESSDQYLSRAVDTYDAQKWMNEELPRGAVVALYGDTRGFYLDRKYVWADYGHDARFSIKHKSVEELLNNLKQHGVTHAMVNLRFFPSRDKAEGTSKLVYAAIDEGRFEQVYPEFEIPRGAVVYYIK